MNKLILNGYDIYKVLGGGYMLDKDKYAEFLEMPEDKRFEYLTGIKLYWWQKLYIKFFNKWWTLCRKANPHLRAIDLWESIYKGRY